MKKYLLSLFVLTSLVTAFFLVKEIGKAQAQIQDERSVTVLSPNNGGTYKMGDYIDFKWSSKNIPSDAYIGIYLSTKENKYAVSIGGFIPSTNNQYRYLVTDSNLLSGYIKSNTPYKVLIYSYKQNDPTYRMVEATSEKDIQFISPPPVDFKILTLPTREDKAGEYDQFYPGGAQNWNWYITIDSPSTTTIDSVLIIRQWVPETWSTNGLYLGYKTWPIVVYKDGKQMNNKYQDYSNIPVFPGINSFRLYGRSNSDSFNSAIISVKLHNGVNLTSQIPEYNKLSPNIFDVLSISASPKEIPSGATTTILMMAHGYATSTELMAVCPQGVRADWLQSTESNKNICNVSKQLNPRSLPPMTLQVFNGNPTTKEISVNFYERFPGNAYAFGSSTRIIVRGLASTTPQCLKLTTNLDEGSTGGEVVALQELLIKLGFLSKDLTQKGYYGPSTTAAVKGFQNSVNITATGSVGPLTREALNNKSCNGVIEDNRPITENAKSGSLAFRLDSANPSSRVVNISSTQNTSDVVLAIFDIKPEGVSSVLNSLKLNVNAISPNWKGSNVNKLFDRVYVKIGDKSYQYDSVEPIVKTEKGQKLVFSNMAAPLPADAWVPVTIYGVVAKNTNNALNKSSAEVVLYASDANVSAVDGNFNNMKVVLKPVLYSGVATFAGSVVSGGVSVSNVNTSFGDPVISNNTVVAYPFFMTFTVNNNGDKDIFMSKKHVGNEITVVISPNTATVSFADNSYTPATITGDSANYVIIPSNTSRVVKYNGVLMNSGMAGYVSYRVTSIFYGNTADVTNNMSIKSGLEGLYIYAMFGGKGAAKDVNAVDTKTMNTTITPTPTYSSTPTSTYTPAPVVTSTPVPTTYVAPASTPTTTTSPTPTTTASPTTTSSPSYNYPTPTYTTSPTSTARPTSSPVSNIFGEYQTASVWSLMLKFLRFTF